MRDAKDLTIARWINAFFGISGLAMTAGGRWLALQFDATPYLFWASGTAIFLTALLFQSFLYRPFAEITSSEDLADFRHRNLLHVTLAAAGTWLYVLGGALVWAQPYSVILATGGSLMLIGVIVGLRGGIPLLRTARFSQMDSRLSSDHTTASQSISYRNAYLFGLQAAVALALLASWNVVELHASTLGFVITAVMVLAQVTTLAWREWANDSA